MPVFHTKQENYTKIHDMMIDVVDKMIDNGFTLMYPTSQTDLVAPTGNYNKLYTGEPIVTSGPGKNNSQRLGSFFEGSFRIFETTASWAAILKPSATINNMAGDRDWAVKFEWTKNQVSDIIGVTKVVVAPTLSKIVKQTIPVGSTSYVDTPSGLKFLKGVSSDFENRSDLEVIDLSSSTTSGDFGDNATFRTFFLFETQYQFQIGNTLITEILYEIGKIVAPTTRGALIQNVEKSGTYYTIKLSAFSGNDKIWMTSGKEVSFATLPASIVTAASGTFQDTGSTLDVIVATPAQFNAIDGTHTVFDCRFQETRSKDLDSLSFDKTRYDQAGVFKEAIGVLGTMYRERSILSAAPEDGAAPNPNGVSSYWAECESETVEGFDDPNISGEINFPTPLRAKHEGAKYFFYRKHIVDAAAPAFPFSYALTIANRGMMFCVWEQTAEDAGNRNSWFCVQENVKASDGSLQVSNPTDPYAYKRPVHCLYQIMTRVINRVYLPTSLTRANLIELENVRPSVFIPTPKTCNIRRFVVCESDIGAPTPTPIFVKDAWGPGRDYAEGGFPFGVPAEEHYVDYQAVINTKQQVAITEDNKYVITVPSGFNTPRYSYTTEMDLIAYTSADVISNGLTISLTLYGESTPRKYYALPCNGPNNSGMRPLMLIESDGLND